MKFKDIDEYISTFPKEVREVLQKIRKTIHETAPEASEAISYGMPTFKLNGNLIHFAGWESHIGIYPVPSAVEAFKDELTQYKTAKGSIQFPLDQPFPYDLLKRMVEFRVKENLAKKTKY